MAVIWLNQDTRVIDITQIKQRIHDNYKHSRGMHASIILPNYVRALSSSMTLKLKNI